MASNQHNNLHVPLRAALAGACLFLSALTARATIAVSNLYSLPSGSQSQSTLAQGTDGNFYGTTKFGGTNGNNGAVFQISPSGALGFQFSFNRANGANPAAGLVQGSDGNFYGTTESGGVDSQGTVFGITTNGTLTNMVSFFGTNGATPLCSLIQASNGTFYGTTFNGGANSKGTIFAFTTNGTLTNLVSFNGTNGANPGAGLVQASDGNFYGTTEAGGSNSSGTVFQMTPSGTLKSLYSFGASGTTPLSGLVQGADGKLYGTTYSGGTGYGTIFNIATNGVFTSLISFNIGNGANPSATLLLASDGNFYGTTEFGGASNYGTIFQMTPGIALTVFYSFGGATGTQPYAGLTQGSDGNLYTVTSSGAAQSGGAICKALTAPMVITAPLHQTVLTGSNAIFVVVASSFGTLNYQWQQNGTNISGATSSTLLLTNVAVSQAGTYTVALVNGLGTNTASAILDVIAAPIIASEPQSQTNFAGATVMFSVTATGGSVPPDYFWQRSSTNLANGGNISGANSSILTISSISAADATNYFVIVSNALGSVTSSVAALTLAGPPTIATQPTNETANLNGSAIFTVVATSSSLSYSWLSNSVSLSDGGSVSGSASATLTISAVTNSDAASYSVIVTNGAGSVTSGVATLTVYDPPVITSQPTNETVSTGHAAVFSVVANGNGLPLNYQWQKNSANLSDGGDIVGASASSLTVDPAYASDAASYAVIVTTTAGSVTSSVVTLTVVPGPFATTLPATFVTGTNATLNGIASPNLTDTIVWFQWGTNVNYGNVTPQMDVGSGNGVMFVSNAISGLVPGVPVYFQLVASNSAVTVYGQNQILDLTRKVWTWGYDGSGQTNVPPGLTNIAAVAAGGSHSLALGPDSMVTAWGDNTFGQTNVPASLTNVIAIAGGYEFSLALGSDNTLTAWGDNSGGQSNTPVAANPIIAIAAGDSHALALQSDGTVLTWGTINSSPAAVPSGLSNIVAIAAGGSHDLAVKNDGTIVAWGDNSAGQNNIPASARSIVAVSAGLDHSVALRNDGTVIAWGQNTYGQTNIPSAATNVVAISAGRFHTVALRSDGTLIAWGNDEFNQTNTPPTLTNALAIASGGFHGLALAADNPPVVTPQIVYVTGNNNQVITLSGTDPDGDALSFIITALPTNGFLYQNNAGIPGALISATNTLVTDPSNNVIYSTTSSVGGAAFDHFQFAASDGLFVSAPAIVTINLEEPPSLITLPVAQVTNATATLNGSVNPNLLPTLVWFQWGTTTNYGSNTAPVQVGNGSTAIPFSAAISNLSRLTQYHVQIVATNIAGISYGNDLIFTDVIQPEMIDSTITASGTFHTEFSGTASTTYSLWASTNLVNWTRVSAATEDFPGTYEATDPTATTNFSYRFYQVQWP